MYKTFGARLKLTLETKGLNQSEFAKLTSLNQSIISRICSDSITPDFRSLQKIIFAIPDIDHLWLIGNPPNPLTP